MSKRQPYDGATPYYGEKMNGEVALWAHKQMAQDRKLIEALRAENARLREALKPFAEMSAAIVNDVDVVYSFTCDDIRAARAAMGDSDE